MTVIALRTARITQLHTEAESISLPSKDIFFPKFIGNSEHVCGIFETREILGEPTSLNRDAGKRWGYYYDIASPRSPVTMRDRAGFGQQDPCIDASGQPAFGRYLMAMAVIRELEPSLEAVAAPEEQYCDKIENLNPTPLEPYNPRADKIFSLLDKLTI